MQRDGGFAAEADDQCRRPGSVRQRRRHRPAEDDVRQPGGELQQHEAGDQRGTALGIAAAALLAQLALGAWVSTNYAVLACTGFPQCNGRWWPTMNWSEGFTLMRELGRRADGQSISMAALVAIQWTHRLFAIVVVLALGWLVACLHRRGPEARWRAGLIAGLVLLQLATGLSNVVLGWPMSAALAHTAGAAALVVCLGREAAIALQPRRFPTS